MIARVIIYVLLMHAPAKYRLPAYALSALGVVALWYTGNLGTLSDWMLIFDLL